MPQLLINSSDADGTRTLVVQGDVDGATVDQFREALARASSTSGNVVIDLSGVPFIDSSGLGALVRALRSAQEAGGSFQVVNAGRSVARAAQYAGLAEHLGMAPA